jgi:arginine N-succinyltransferase
VLESVGACGPTAADPALATACIFPRIGVEWPFYSYRLARQTQTHKALRKTLVHEVLVLTNDFDGAAEVGGLFVDPKARGVAAGRLMARSRYLFMAGHRDWFGRRVISDVRGYQDPSGRSPVWEALGRVFYDMDFDAADRLNAAHGNQFIADLAPKHPIYASLLPRDAREALGAPHPEGRRAMALLVEEGFRHEGYVDIFDGGPTLCADIDELKGVRDSRAARIVRIGDDIEAPDSLIGFGSGRDFRAARGALCATDDGRAELDQGVAAALGVKVGDSVRHVAF